MKIQIMKKLLILSKIILISSILTACNANNSPINGTWERVDVKTNSIQIFSADNSYQIKSNNISVKGKYELKDNTLRIVLIDEKTGKENQFDEKYKVLELSENLLVLEQTDGVKQTYKKISK